METDRHWDSVEVAKDLIHAVTLDATKSFESEVGRIDNLGLLRVLKKEAVKTYKKDLTLLGEGEMAQEIVNFQYDREIST